MKGQNGGRIVTCFAIFGTFLSFRCGPEPPRPERAVVGEKLTLQGFQPIGKSGVFRADLSEPTGGLSSGYRTRNVMFIEASGQARWLLPDNNHSLYQEEVRPAAADGDKPQPAVALAILAFPVNPDSTLGQLYLCDLLGQRMQRVADGVKQLRGSSLVDDTIVLLYERPEGYVLGHYNSSTFAIVHEVRVNVPALK
jgi:hypothetical protein